MLWITVVLALLLSSAAVAFVLWPILRRDAPLMSVEDDRLAELLARKDRALRSIKELEFDHQVGKLSDEDYARFYERLSRQAILLIQQVEKITPATTELDAALEEEIAQLRRVQATTRLPTEIAQGEPAAESMAIHANGETAASNTQSPSDIPVVQTRFCTECGTKVESTFKFCANCGTPLGVSTEQSTA